jgi:hypothetical protein
MKKTNLRVIAMLAVVLFLINSLNVVQATYVNNLHQDKLPDFLERMAEYLSQGNVTELKRIRSQMIQQEKIKQEMIKSTNGAILDWSDFTKVTTKDTFTRYVTDITYASPDTQYPVPPYTIIGKIENEDLIEGSYPDGSCAYLEATGYYEYPPGSGQWHSGEAISRGDLDDLAYGNTHIGVYAKEGPLTGTEPLLPYAIWKNYLIVMVAYNPSSMWDWNYIGYVQVFSDTVQGFYIGSTDLTYDEISITTYCPANCYPIEKSSVYVDCAQVLRYE